MRKFIDIKSPSLFQSDYIRLQSVMSSITISTSSSLKKKKKKKENRRRRKGVEGVCAEGKGRGRMRGGRKEKRKEREKKGEKEREKKKMERTTQGVRCPLRIHSLARS